MTWLIFALLGPIFWGLANVMDSALRRKFVQNDAALTWMVAISRLPFFILFFALSGFKAPGLADLGWMILGGALWTLPFFFYYRALKLEDPSRIALLEQTIPLFTLLIAFFALGERLTANQGIAFGLLILAGILASLKQTLGRWRLSPAFALILLATLLWAASDVIFKKFEPSFAGFLGAFGFYFLGSSLTALAMLAMPRGKHILDHFKALSGKAWASVAATEIGGILGSLSFAYALTLGKASLTSVMIGIQPLAAFLIGLGLAPLMKEISHEDIGKKALLLKGTSFALVVVGLAILEK